MRKTLMLLAILGLVGSLRAADPIIGTWKLNASKTQVKSPAGNLSKDSTVKIEAQENGIKLTWDAVKADGTVIHGVFAAKYDGRDYPVRGDPGSDTVSLKKIDANTVEFTFKKDAKAIFNERAIVSVDGKTIRLIVISMDSKGKSGEATLMYDRQ